MIGHHMRICAGILRVAPGAALIGVLFAVLCGAPRCGLQQDTDSAADPVAYSMAQLNRQRAAADRSYLSFLNVPTLHCGIYHLPAGAVDNQSPHSEDEVYYVERGQAKFHCDGQDYDVAPGSILFVKAQQEHHFFEIQQDLTLLVFFSKAKPQ